MTDALYVEVDTVKAASPSTFRAVADATIEARIVEFAEVAEDYCGVAFAARTVTGHRISLASPRPAVVLPWPMVQSVDSVTDAGSDVDPAGLDVTSAGVVWRSTDHASCWTGPVVVTFTHGYAATPAAVARACCEYVARSIAQDAAGTSRDVIVQGFDGGSSTRYATPDKTKGRPTGWFEPDRLLTSHMRNVGLA